jgi:hypothetical protein
MRPIPSSTTRTLYSNGCSFTAGSELEFDPAVSGELAVHDRAAVLAHQQRYAWPRVLGNLAGFDLVVNEAMGAGSNARAVRMTIGFVARYLRDGGEPRNLLVCVGITDLKRSERWEEEDGGVDFSPGEGAWRLLKPRLSGPNAPVDRHSRKCNRLYFRYLFSERQAVLALVHQVLLLQSTLDAYGVAFHLHDAMSVNRPVLARWLDRTPEAALVDRARCPVLQVDSDDAHGISFEDWALVNRVPIGPHGHPLADGHRGWASALHARLEEGELLGRGRGR